VLVFHGGHLLGGYLGVDAFFVLSGFLITSLLLAEAGRSGRIGLKAFWSRRFRRLLPALVVLVLGVSLYAALMASTVELARIRTDALATLAYVANWNSVFRQHGYWELFSAPSPLEHTWSLAIEEQFYLVWPLVFAGLVWLSRWRGRDLARSVLRLSLFLAVCSASLMWYLYTPGGDTTRVYLGTDTRAAAILLGAAFAAWRWSRRPVARGWVASRLALEVAGFVAAIGLAVAWARLDGQNPLLYRGGLLACGVAVVVVIAASSHEQAGPLSRALAWSPLRWFGLISYGLYLWHWPIYLILNGDRTGLSGWPLFGLQIVASVAVAVVSFYLIEQPVRRGRLRVVPMRVWVPAGALVGVVAIVLATSGQVRVPASRSISLAEGGASPSASVGELRALAAVGDGQAKLLIVGDSLADSMAAGVKTLTDPQPFVTANGSADGCALTADVTALRLTSSTEAAKVSLSDACEPRWNQAFAAFHPNLVVVAYGNASGFEKFQIGGRWLGPCDAGFHDWYVPEMTRILTAFSSAGSGVAVATLPYPVGDWLPADARLQIDCMNRLNRSTAAAVHADVIDLGGMVCPGGHCITTVDGAPLRADGVHFGNEGAFVGQAFSGPGTEYAARWLFTTLQVELAAGRLQLGVTP
jgi:peptidoglycan/LPS O-acetylase OafA/YrhL